MSKFQTLSALFAALALLGNAGLDVTRSCRASTIDTATQGNWIGTYGSNGYILNGYATVPSNSSMTGVVTSPASPSVDLASLPSYVSSYSYSTGTNQYVWQANSMDVRAPEDPRAGTPGTAPRVAATAYDSDNYSVTLNLNHAENFQLAVYGLDWDNNAGGTRSATVTVNGDTAQFNNTTIANAYNQGEWAIFNVHALAGPLVINLTEDGNPATNNVVISAIAFDHSVATPEPASFVLAGLGTVGLLLAARRRRRA